METLQPDDPRELGGYRLLRRLGAGGMGRVYLARSPGGRTVAVKVVRPDLAADADFRARFRHEVETARAVSGRFTAPVVDADPDAALPWLATSYVLGPDLTDVVAAHGALPERTVQALAAGLAGALQEVHAAGLVHRDLKPSNVLLAADGPRVIDFGIARAVDGNRMTQTGVVVGSPGFMSPEQAMGKDVGTASDIFSLGTVLTFAATGRGAFGDGAASHASLLYQVVHGEPDLEGVPESLAGLIRACLMKDPEQRPTPEQIVTALAPQGVETVLSDWLPSAVASTIATHAGGILDLEAPEAAAGAPAEAPAAFGPPPTMGAVSQPVSVPGSAPAAAAYDGGPVAGYGSPQGGAPAPGHGAGGASLPGTVRLGASEPVRSRRRVLGYALGALAGVTAVGGTAAWWATRDDGTATTDDSAGRGGSAQPAGERFTTPPPGVAPQPLWHKSAAEDSTNAAVPPLSHGGLMLVSGDPLVAYDVTSGKARWSRPGICRPGAPLLFHDGKVFLADGDYEGALVAYRVTDGGEAWRSRLGKALTVESTIAIDERNVYVTAKDFGDSKSATEYRTAVAAISHSTGRQVWLQRRDWGTRDYDVQGTVSGKHLVYADSNRNLTVRDTATGEQLWTKKLGEEWSWRPTVTAGLVLLPGDELTAVDVESGERRWTLSSNGRGGFRNPTAIDRTLYVSDHDRGVWAVNPKTGKRIWLCDELETDGPETFLRAGSSLYGATGDLSGGVVALDSRTGKQRWMYDDNKRNGEPWQLALSGSRLLITHGPEIYALPAV